MDLKGVKSYLDNGAQLRLGLDHKKIYELGLKLSETFKSGNKLIVFGNGGSAADSQHIAEEFVCKFRKDRKALPAMALNVSIPSLTAIANDYDFSRIFEREIEAFASKGDMVIGISTSGNSANVINGLKKAGGMGCYTVGLTGKNGTKLRNAARFAIVVDSTETSLVQEMHMAIGHLLAWIVEDAL